jgi:hypothetical protein
MHRILALVAGLAATLILSVPAAASPGIISVTAPAVVKLDDAGIPQASAVVSAVYRSGYDGGALTLAVAEWGKLQPVLDEYLPAGGARCERPPSYRCASRLRLRDLRRVGGQTLRRNRLYVVTAGFESYAGSSAPTLDPGVRFAAFWAY